MTKNEFLNEVDALANEKNDRWFMAGCIVILLVLILTLSGCATRNTASAPTAASVNKSVTTVIADAGAVANQAKQEYLNGQLPQTKAVRTAINDLGTAYTDASAAYVVELRARAAYQNTLTQQIAACKPEEPPAATPAENGTTPTPAATTPTTTQATPSGQCQSLTAAANARKVADDQAAAQLDQKVSVLASKTAAVKVIKK